jgi:glycosyltransferase involved in cell wall biosynthesis
LSATAGLGRTARALRLSAGGPAALVLSSHRPPERLGLDAPRLDFVELAAALGASLSYPPQRLGPIGRIERRSGMSFSHALQARRERSTEVFVSLSEGVGLPLATLDRGATPHVMVAHNLLRPRMRAYSRLTRSLARVDRVVVLSRSQADFLRECQSVAPERIRFVHDKVDHRFWAAQGASTDGSVVSVGRESRDYATLVAATRPLDVPTVIVAGSLWADAARAGAGEHVSFRGGLSFPELRDLYDRAAVAVVPLHGGERFAAGVNAVMEAMAMGKALIVTDTPGIADYVADGETARVVPAGDPAALRDVIAELLGDEHQRRRLGEGARAVIDGGRNLDGYVAALVEIVDEVRLEHDRGAGT